MNKTYTQLTTIFVSMLLSTTFLHAQKQTPLNVASRYVDEQREQWQLTQEDVSDIVVNDQYATQHNGVTHIYFMQRYAGTPVYNAIMGIHVDKNGKVGFATQRFIPKIASKINTTVPQLSAKEAILRAAEQLGMAAKASPKYLSTTSKGELVFEDVAISRAPIYVQRMYQPMADGTVRLAWDLAIQSTETADYWSVRIDALNGNLLSKDNWTVYCNFPDDNLHPHEDCVEEIVTKPATKTVREALMEQQLFPVDGARYNVFPIPVESPVHGDREFVINPADSVASPFGWHDTNGQAGPEYTITRGNNVHSFADTQGNNVSNQDEPDGGLQLTFDYPFDPTAEPASYRDAATTQLFYMNNFMHDFTYQYGFDEVAGNFQQNNYSKGGSPGDYVLAQAQDASGNNNANFSTPPDGRNGTMQMYLWGSGSGEIFTVTAPEVIAGNYAAGTAGFGPQIGNTPISGQVVEAFSNASSVPSQGCSTISNAAEVAGKIALVDRGDCFFEEKAVNAQAAGAIAVIICNFENTTIPMGGVGTIQDPNIPTVMLSSASCQVIRQNINDGVMVTLQRNVSDGPAQYDGSFDNGIVAHEYGHGISNRLTGGPSTSSCLSNDEQMGEGWSDFFALVTTVRPDDVSSRARGIGGYVFNRNPEGKGFRRFPYSTDMTINNQVYDNVIDAAIPHGVGEIWAVTLWDLYWKFVEVYGFDEDLYNGTGGNNVAIQLVMDGMKLQNCNPGYLEGRDAILAADLLNNDGANQCLIWEVFSRRGLGYDASQGSAFNAYDARSGFAMAPECVKELKIAKTSSPLINAGDEMSVSIVVTNHKNETVTNVVLSDLLPEGTSYIAGSLRGIAEGTFANGVAQFDLGDMASGAEVTISYKLATALENQSVRQFYDGMENGYDNWTFEGGILEGSDVWDITEAQGRSNSNAWYVSNTERENDQSFILANPFLVTGNQPVLRFYHNYDTDPGLDGGILQISTNNGLIWESVDGKFIRNDYFSRISYFAFSMPDTRAFWGNSNGFIDSYVDLSDYIGQEILVRFRFGSDEERESGLNLGNGWAIDDIEFMDMYNYNTEACVTSAQGDQACAIAEGAGTVVESSVLTSIDDPQTAFLQMRLYPNPAQDVVNLTLSALQNTDATLRIFSADGKLVQHRALSLFADNQTIPLNVSALAEGMYFVEIRTPSAVLTEKMMIH